MFNNRDKLAFKCNACAIAYPTALIIDLGLSPYSLPIALYMSINDVVPFANISIACAIYVHPSRYGGMPLRIVNSMAASDGKKFFEISLFMINTLLIGLIGFCSVQNHWLRVYFFVRIYYFLVTKETVKYYAQRAAIDGSNSIRNRRSFRSIRKDAV